MIMISYIWNFMELYALVAAIFVGDSLNIMI